ncbi:hypothetical protein V1515DRAFT_609988, partial [Lipomyces mesembrius]
MTSRDDHIALWQRFLNANIHTEFVFVQFMGYNANILTRAIPVARFADLYVIPSAMCIPKNVDDLLCWVEAGF